MIYLILYIVSHTSGSLMPCSAGGEFALLVAVLSRLMPCAAPDAWMLNVVLSLGQSPSLLLEPPDTLRCPGCVDAERCALASAGQGRRLLLTAQSQG